MTSCSANTMLAWWVTRWYQTHSWTRPWWWLQTQAGLIWMVTLLHPSDSSRWTFPQFWILSMSPTPWSLHPLYPSCSSYPFYPSPTPTYTSFSSLALPAPSPDLCTSRFTLIDHCHLKIHHKIIFMEVSLSEQPCFKAYELSGSQKAPSLLPDLFVPHPMDLKESFTVTQPHCLFSYLIDHISEPWPWLFSWSSLKNTNSSLLTDANYYM